MSDSHAENQKTPDPNVPYPVGEVGGRLRTVFLKNIIKHPQIVVGDYTYYDDPEDLHNFEKNVLYLFGTDTKLIVGKFCSIASGVRFIMNGANHALDGISVYPFLAFAGAWQERAVTNVVSKGDTIVGNDVWIGNSVTIMPGVTIGDGAIIGTNSLVTKDVQPYTIVGGNPAKIIRKRFDEESIEFLVKLAWWDWPVEKITENLPAITTGDLKALKEKYGL
mmetsp:Transcript_5821/g.22097  ORF Transcript_5821/g.22097 Transcript_5821/m.22097 type:complete len:221 (-) Transcript_5821:36-698(-)